MLPTQDLTEKTKKEGYVHAERLACINPFSIIAAYVSVTAVPCSCARKAMTTGQELLAVSQRGYLLVRKKGRLRPHMSNVLHLACSIRRLVTESATPSKSCHARGLCLPYLRPRVCLEGVTVCICGPVCADEGDKSRFV